MQLSGLNSTVSVEAETNNFGFLAEETLKEENLGFHLKD